MLFLSFLIYLSLYYCLSVSISPVFFPSFFSLFAEVLYLFYSTWTSLLMFFRPPQRRRRLTNQTTAKPSPGRHHLQPDLTGQASGANPASIRLLERPVLPDGVCLRQPGPQVTQGGFTGSLCPQKCPPYPHQLRSDGSRQRKWGEDQNYQSC